MLYNKYFNLLTNTVIPCYVNLSIDESGAVNNMLLSDVTEEKYVRSQGRALKVFSSIYNFIEKNPIFLEFSHGTFNYIANNLLTDNCVCKFEKIVNIDTKIYFLAGIVEYLNAATDVRAEKCARSLLEKTYSEIKKRCGHIKKTKSLADMAYFAFICDMFNETIKRGDKEKDAYFIAKSIFNVLSEKINSYTDEAMYALFFLMKVFEKRNDKEKIDVCCHLIKKFCKNTASKGINTYRGFMPLGAVLASLYAFRYTRDKFFTQFHNNVTEPFFLKNLLDINAQIKENIEKENEPFYIGQCLIYICEMLEDK